jgi:hypothetical protein
MGMHLDNLFWVVGGSASFDPSLSLNCSSLTAAAGTSQAACIDNKFAVHKLDV